MNLSEGLIIESVDLNSLKDALINTYINIRNSLDEVSV